MIKAISIRCESKTYFDLEELKPLQGNLKELSKENFERLKNQLITNGVTSPLSIWIDPETQVKYITDGHQRRLALISLRGDGYEIPPIPASIVEANTKSSAASILLGQASSYGEATIDGLYEFMNDHSLAWSDVADSISFPDIDNDEFGAGMFGDEEKIEPVYDQCPTCMRKVKKKK